MLLQKRIFFLCLGSRAGVMSLPYLSKMYCDRLVPVCSYSIGFSCKLVTLCGVWSPALSFLSAVLFLKVSLNSCVQVRCGVCNLPMDLPVKVVHCIRGKNPPLVGTIAQSVGASASTGSPTSSVPSSSESNVNISSTQFYATLTHWQLLAAPGRSWQLWPASGSYWQLLAATGSF